MSGNRKRPGAGGNILDQLEPRSGRGKGTASFSIGIDPRWVWAGGGAIVLLVGALAAIAWSSTTVAKPLPSPQMATTAEPAPPRLAFETGPAKVERVSLQSQTAAKVLLAQVDPPPMPPPMPLVVLPREATPPAKVVRQPSGQKPAAGAPSRAAKPATQRQASRRAISKAQRAKPVPAPEAAPDTDPDVALIRAIRKATQSQ
ncbi:MAG TPA: hypothetical protein VGE60_01710 [Telluria sp.]